LTLARLPTPLEPMPRFSAWLGAEVWVKRDDLTGLELSGNKVRKLELLLTDAQAAGADTIITCGGLQSNHCRATAAACRRLGLRPVLLLRGDVDAVPESNHLLDRLYGADLHACTPAEYSLQREGIMALLAGWHEGHGRRPYVIPEGGSNAIGSWAYALAIEELGDARFDGVFAATGSGGTLAGLAMGRDVGPVIGVAVCDDAAYFEAKVRAIAAEGGRPVHERWRVLDAYKGPAYGVADDATWEAIRVVARTEGLLLDPVYTGKAMAALIGEVRAGRAAGRLLFWHTGGAFGLFGRGAEIAALPPEPDVIREVT
jgi:D-cysteine desulfhydrase